MNFPLPELGEGVYEAELVAWHVKPGDAVKRGQTLMEVMTDKATSEVPSPFAGTIGELRAEPGQQVKVGDVMLTYSGGDGATKAEAATRRRGDAATESNGGKKESVASGGRQPPVEAAKGPPTPATGGLRPSLASAFVRAAPSVRLMARKLGIDLAAVHGSGPGGRVLIEDLSKQVQAAAPAAAARPAEPKPDYGTPGSRIKLIGIRRKIAEHMVLSKRSIPHYSYMDECDVTDLVRLREQLKEPLLQQGVRLTYLAFLVKAIVHALQEVPLVNAVLDEQAGEIVLHDKYNIGVAVAAPAGLIVPVVHDVEKKDLVDVARDIDRLSSEARAGKAKLEDLKGGTFTVTSVGNIGGLISTPVINHPEVGILGVGKIVQRPVYDAHGSLRPADIIYLSFSFDHRVVDGAVGAAFGNAVIQRLQAPAALLIPS